MLQAELQPLEEAFMHAKAQPGGPAGLLACLPNLLRIEHSGVAVIQGAWH